MKNFYIVRDETDLLSGNIIPKKVLDYIPANAFGAFNPVFQPIRKSSELVITPQTLSPVYSPFHNPLNNQASISKTIIPLGPLGPVQQSNCGSTLLTSPCSSRPLSPFTCNTQGCNSVNNPVFGPPIVKLTPMISSGIGGTIKIISPLTTYTINVPARFMRSVVNDIYLNSQVNLSPLDQKITFRIITPSMDSSLQTTHNKMVETVKMINNKYSGLTFLGNDGTTQNLAILLDLLNSRQLF